MTEDSTREPDEIVTKLSPRSVPDTVARLTGILSDKGLKLFAVIDQSAEAAAALPLKVLVWADRAQTKVSYVAPAVLGARYGLTADLTAKLAGIDPLTDALVAP